MNGGGTGEAERNASGSLEDMTPASLAVGENLNPLVESAQAIGVDSGATLVKICVQDRAQELHFATWHAPASDRILALLDRLSPTRIGLTGCGASAIAPRLDREVATPVEFDAWGQGANSLLAEMGRDTREPYLLVSIGTGTSILRVEGDQVDRTGGTGLGGGTALGLGLALTNCKSHHEFTQLAARGRRGGVDLLISDLYDQSEGPLAAEATAASFGKLARGLGRSQEPESEPRPEDLAAAIMGLVAENIALICNAHARITDVKTVVFGGSSLADNPRLVETVRLLTTLHGFEAVVLPQSGHAGAIGAMLLSR
jgi:type II pantothenate kinase